MNRLPGLLVLFIACSAAADVVVTVESVESYVNVRKGPNADTAIVGRLNKGEPLVHVSTTDGWHEVELAEGGTGFVHGKWAEVVGEKEVALVATESAEAAFEADTAAETDSSAATATETVEQPEPVAESEPVAEPEPIAEPESGDEAQPETGIAAAAAPGPQGPPGPPGPQGPPGPPGTSANGKAAPVLKGTQNRLVRFKGEHEGGNSQVFDDGNFVGIGTTEPKQRLEVNGSIQVHDQNSSVAGLMITQSSGDTGYVLHNRANTLTIGAGSVDRITIDRNGNVGFSVERPSHPFEMASGAYVSEGGVWTNSSSRVLKQDVRALTADDANAALAALQAVHFRYRQDSAEAHLGFIAEDVPELVATGDRRGLSPMDIVAVLTRVIQEQQERIEKLEARVAEAH